MSIEALGGASGRLRAVNSILHEFSDYRSSTMGWTAVKQDGLPHPRNGKVNNPRPLCGG